MGGTFTNLNYHLVFSTKGRRPFIDPALRPRLYEYMGGTLRDLGGVLMMAGGTSDHVHLLVRWRPDDSVSGLLQTLKSHSTLWVHKTFGRNRRFNWQDGFGAFTVSESRCSHVQKYIVGQIKHHEERDFKTEFRALLDAHKIEYDEKYIWR